MSKYVIKVVEENVLFKSESTWRSTYSANRIYMYNFKKQKKKNLLRLKK